MKKPNRPSRAKRAARARQTPRRRGKALRRSDVPAYEAEGVTAGQYLFALEWFAHDFNGTQAWLKLHPNCREASARVQAAQTLALPNVKTFIKKRFEQVIGPLEASATEMAARIGAASRFDPRELFNDKNELLPVKQWPLAAAMALKNVEGRKVTFESRVALARLVFELEGRLKNPEAVIGDALAELLQKTIELHGRHE